MKEINNTKAITVILAAVFLVLPLFYIEFSCAETAPFLAEVSKNNKSISYRVTKRFKLKALADLYTMQFKFPLARKDIPNQQISDSYISPNPNALIHDSDGNEIAVFYFSNVKNAETINVVISYKVAIEQPDFEIDPSSIPDDYADLNPELQSLLKPEEDVDIDDEQLQKKLQEIIGGIKNPYLKGKAIYDFIINNIKYESVEHKSGLQKPGETLVSKRGNCADLAKLYITFSRACGIPTRQVDGSIFEPNISNLKGILKEGHAWVEIYLPVYGWVPVDPTFGLTKKDKFYAFKYKIHIREFYGKLISRNPGTLFSGMSLQVRTQSQYGSLPIEQGAEVEVDLL